MSLPPDQAGAGELLARLTGAAPVETHISAVYVGREHAWKLKKAVALGFLDFTRLAERERLLRRELALNAPFAPGLYREVVPVTRGADGGLRLGGKGEPVEWVLRMAPLPPGDFLDKHAAAEFDAARLDALADAVFAMHAALPPQPAPGFRAVIEGNGRAALGAGLPEHRVGAWVEAALGWLHRLGPLLAGRAAEGRVRRCHGDLHLGNLCLWQGRVTPFDALEFDEALATVDTGYDLAFLLMDCEHRLGRAAANRVLNRYAARSGDAGLVAALPLWLSLRAMIRAHAEAKRGGDGLAYLDRAEALLHPAPARLVAVGGLQGTGKTRLARALAPMLGPAPGALVLRSDEIRKRLAGVPPEQRLPPSAYTPEASAAVFAELAAEAEAALRAGHAMIADAVFLRPEERMAIEAAARAAGVPFDGIWLTAPRAVLEARIAARTGDASDADLAVLAAAAARDAGPLAWRMLDAAGDPLPAACEALGCNGADPC
ncbi:AAA family ATPase [Belnapia sp. F-4-1]|uniref:bifunctional aminoglycoside phosphotransferase/ATP-binding protein n=1 Tax=Belnapia sp. F-4-1 TaxID=1545443 RepID=UPI00068DDFE8|nr:AAA family ATPase [Belnapia sp. F-4-1]